MKRKCSGSAASRRWSAAPFVRAAQSSTQWRKWRSCRLRDCVKGAHNVRRAGRRCHRHGCGLEPCNSRAVKDFACGARLDTWPRCGVQYYNDSKDNVDATSRLCNRPGQTSPDSSAARQDRTIHESRAHRGAVKRVTHCRHGEDRIGKLARRLRHQRQTLESAVAQAADSAWMANLCCSLRLCSSSVRVTNIGGLQRNVQSWPLHRLRPPGR